MSNHEDKETCRINDHLDDMLRAAKEFTSVGASEEDVRELTRRCEPGNMRHAPKDRPILAYCIHDADPYSLGEGKLTRYGAHCEGLASAPDGWHVVEWGGGYTCGDRETGYYDMPDWWFRTGSEFEEVANPIYWVELPEVPASITG